MLNYSKFWKESSIKKRWAEYAKFSGTKKGTVQRAEENYLEKKKKQENLENVTYREYMETMY